MLLTDQYIHNKSIMICLLGRPNAGKSSLVNYLMGFDLSPVTSKPQTTRNRFNCIFTIDHTEVVLIDTPGIHRSGKEINKRMNDQAIEAAVDGGADINLLLLDLTSNIEDDFKELLYNLGANLTKSWIAFTKSDLVKMEEIDLEAIFAKIKEQAPMVEKYFVVSNQDGSGIHLLTGAICDQAQSGRHLYPSGECSNKTERFFATEYIREQAFEVLHDEIPYEVAVVIDEYKDFRGKSEDYVDIVMKKINCSEEQELSAPTSRSVNDKPKEPLAALISASILVNRPSQRGIVVGKSGAVIKIIGTRARQKIQAMVGGKVRLNLHVKVSPQWFKNNHVLQEMGLPRSTNSTRVWRQN